jgi:hypothetical protein
MAEITIENEPGEERLEELGVRGWPTWQAAVSTFPWTYDEPVTSSSPPTAASRSGSARASS